MKRIAIYIILLAVFFEGCTKGGELVNSEDTMAYAVTGDGDSHQMVPEMIKPTGATANFKGMYAVGTNSFNFSISWNNLYTTVKDTITSLRFYGPAGEEYLGDPMQFVNLNSSTASGTLSYSLSGIQGLRKSSMDDLLAGKLYYVLSTKKFPEGILRGQLKAAPGDYSKSLVKSISFKSRVLVMTSGQQLDLNQAIVIQPVYASNKTIIWESADPTSATVDANGKATALKSSIVKIYAKATDGTGKIGVVTLAIDYIPVSSVTLLEKSLDLLTIGSTTTLHVETILPANANLKEVVWSSSDESIATVSEDGVVTGVGAGQATITASAADEFGATASIVVGVINNASAKRIEAERFTSGNVKAETNANYTNGGGIGSIRNNYTAVFDNDRLKLKDFTFMEVNAGSLNTGNVTVEIRENSANGNLLGSVVYQNTGGWQTLQKRRVLIDKSAITNPDAETTICLVFKGNNEWLINVDWVEFK
ncbi:Ig-like domain-containing protein [Desertivirga xinjiangensis]|uniref:Ig-like domain-containing protein n=1 Tax=Desertivirga xinjiangensis TaxID=539206 RepID=UPI00210EB8A3|nr:Ig-like domain-containing protein [Pedobacter xinjiangensis]